MFCILLLCRLSFLPWLPTYVTVCIDGLDFYAIVRMWYVCINYFACLPEDISANRQENGYVCILVYLCCETKGLTDSNMILHWCTAVTTTTSENIGFRFQQKHMMIDHAASLFNLSSDHHRFIKNRYFKQIVKGKSCECECSCSDISKTMPNCMNTDQLTEEVALCCDELCSRLACSPELLE